MAYLSRAKRLDKALSTISDSRTQVEELRGELQQWLDNLPENLQSSNKASMLEEAISNLEDIISHCEEAEGISVDFPGMYS